jgi:hypothetical protein
VMVGRTSRRIDRKGKRIVSASRTGERWKKCKRRPRADGDLKARLAGVEIGIDRFVGGARS